MADLVDIDNVAPADSLKVGADKINLIRARVDGLYTVLSDITAAEATQVEAIGATTISAAQWAYVGAANQSLITTASPTFAGLTLSGGFTLGGILTLAGNVVCDDYAFTGVGDMTFTNGSILASGTTASDTLILKANDTTCITLTTGTTDKVEITTLNALTAINDLDIGAHDFRAATLTADGLTPGRLVRAGTAGLLGDATVTESSGALGGITTLSMNNQLTNSLADGTTPLVITSTTKVSNLNVDRVDGAHASPTPTASYIVIADASGFLHTPSSAPDANYEVANKKYVDDSTAATVTVVDESADTECFVGYFTAASGSLAVKTGTNLTFNSNTGILTATGFAGNVTGDCSGSSGSCTGQAATVATITGLAPDTATTQATQASITSCANLATIGTVTSGTLSTGAVLADVTMTLGSDADGDIYYRASNVLTRLPKGTGLHVLRMNAGATAPEWAAGGVGTVDTSGTPQANDYARFTDADTIEGRDISEVFSDLGLDTNLADLTTAEVAQLENIGTVTVSATQWGALGALVEWTDWTPTLTGGADLSGYDFARYYRVGDICFFYFAADTKNVTTSGIVQITLPFTTANTSVIPINYSVYDSANEISTSVYVNKNTNYVNVLKTILGGNWAGTENGVNIRISGFFEIA